MNISQITLHLLYFAQLREQLQCAQETITLSAPSPINVSQLKTQLIEHHAQTSNQASTAFTSTLLCAVNQTVVGEDHILSNNDEVAFFPPVTGG